MASGGQRTARPTKLDRPQAGGYRFVAATGVFLFPFLYLYPLEDDLDLDEEVEEERR